MVLALTMAASGGLFGQTPRVVERGQQRGIFGADVRLGDTNRALTSDGGTFEIRGIRPGSYPLVVEAVGYRTIRTVVNVTGMGDVTGVLQMDPEPIALDSIHVRPTRITIRGRIVEKGTERGVAFIRVRAGDAGETTTNDAGGFSFSGMYAERHVLTIEGFGWLPVNVSIAPTADTTILVTVERDPMADRMIAAEIGVISERSRSVSTPLRVISRRDILESRGATPVEVLKGRGVQVVSCPGMTGYLCVPSGLSRAQSLRVTTPPERRPMVWIDDQPVCGLEVLQAYPNALIERIEVLDNGTSIRAYTSWFLQGMMAKRVILQPLTPWDRSRPC
jgi:hypothetical protein